MGLISARGNPPPETAVRLAVNALQGGDIVGLPTDTVYGLAADPFRTGAADRLFLLKGRPRNVELPVLVADEAQALSLCTAVPLAARRLMERFWPGPLTLVLPRRPELQADLGEDDATIGIRCPAHPVPLAVCAWAGPIATTSANRHQEPPLTTAMEVVTSLGPEVALVLDAGPCTGLPSTVVDCTGEAPRVLRPGRLSTAEVLAVAG
ncbi:MAG TPA: L-threonylcarbamoyladenylate synthase [Acidimicrobiales bacterium]|nr:L-threonylcarbamoyladenylate synthase [Acidimicrobiales bacterium]